MNSVEARPYLSEHRAACLAVFDSNTPDDFAEAERPLFEAFLDDLPGPYSVLTNARRAVVGCGGIAMNPDQSVSLCWGMIAREVHRRGFGTFLTQHRIELARSTWPSATTMLSNTSPQSAPFYARLGFVEVSRVANGHAAGMDAVLMTRPIVVR